MGFNSGQMTTITCSNDDAKRCVHLGIKKINAVMFVQIPLWLKGEICAFFMKFENLLTLQV